MGTPKRDGPNWVVLAGGAIVMAVGIVIGRKQIQCQGDREQGQRRGVKKGAFSPLSGMVLNFFFISCWLNGSCI